MKKVNNNSYYEKHRKYYEKAVRMYFEEGLGYRRISKLIPVAVTTLARWCDTFAKENGITMEKKVLRRKSPEPLETDIEGVANDVTSLKAEVSRLRKALKQEQLRADAFNAMIDVAEARFNIPIRKKKSWRQTVINLHARSRRNYPVEGLCILFGRTKQAFYKYNEERMARRIVGECFVVDFIKEIRTKDHGIGGLKLWYMYQRKFTGEEALGRDRFLEVYRRNGLKLRSKSCKTRTTDSTHGLATYANLIRDFIPTGPNQLWVSDITYIAIYRSEEGYCFCYIITPES